MKKGFNGILEMADEKNDNKTNPINKTISRNILNSDPRYILISERQGVAIYFDSNSINILLASPPIYEITGTYYHLKTGENTTSYSRTSIIRYDEKSLTTWSQENYEWKELDTHGNTMFSIGNRELANTLFRAAYGRPFYNSIKAQEDSRCVSNIPNEYSVYDRMPREAPTEAPLEVISNFSLYDNPRSATVIGSVSKGEVVNRVSCIVYTYPQKYPVRVVRPIKCYKKNNHSNSPEGPLLEIGSYVYLLMYTGEGTYLGWYKGEEVWWLQGSEIDNLYGKICKNSWGKYEGDVLSKNLSVEVWYKIKKIDGTAGWTLVAQNGDFSHEPVKPFYGHKPVATNNDVKSTNSNANDSSMGKLLFFASILILLVLIGLNNTNNYNTSTSKNNPAKQVTNNSQQTATSNDTKSNQAPIEPIAKNNVITGYDDTKPILNADGLCELTVDNSRNNMPVYVRIWDIKDNVPVRAFYISQGDKFTADNLSPGWYQVRYIELYDNDFPSTGAKSENFELEQTNTYNGIQYSQMTLTLYKVRNGNTYTSSIPADQI